jgi:hypothetical protein
MFGLLLTLVGIGAACALLYNAAVYALPVAIGLWTGFGALHLGAGEVTSVAIGFLAGGFAFALGHIVFDAAKPGWVRILVAAAFVVPAAFVGYSSGEQLSALSTASHLWQQIYGLAGGIAVGSTAFMRLVTPVVPVRA